MSEVSQRQRPREPGFTLAVLSAILESWLHIVRERPDTGIQRVRGTFTLLVRLGARRASRSTGTWALTIATQPRLSQGGTLNRPPAVLVGVLLGARLHIFPAGIFVITRGSGFLRVRTTNGGEDISVVSSTFRTICAPKLSRIRF